MFAKEAEEAKALYDKLYSQGYPCSQVQYTYWPWARGYFASGYASEEQNEHHAILDVGCGRQGVQKLFEETFPRYAYFGLDVAPVVKPFYLCSAHNIPLPDNHTRFIWSCEFIEHLPEEMVEPTLAEMARVLHHKAFLSVATGLSGRVVGGKNLHLTVHDTKWWRERIEQHFLIDDFWSPQSDRDGYLLRV